MFYPVHRYYVGPNKTNSCGQSTVPESVGRVEIYDVPQKTNMSQEEKTEGWLGTTNDICKIAMGEFKSIEQARAAIAKNGWTIEAELNENEFYYTQEECGLVEIWTKIVGID